MSLTVAELQTLFVADISNFEKGAGKVDTAQKALAKSDPVVKVDADTSRALDGMARVEADARTIDSTTATAKLDADNTLAKAGVKDTITSLADVDGKTATAKVDADATAAKAGVGEAEAALARVDGSAATIFVDAVVDGARKEIGSLGGEGSKAGEDAGEGLSAGIIGALATIPIAGAVVGIGVAIGKSLMDGMQVEVRSDALMAKTGLDEKSIAPIARAAGEAYAGNFGESIEANMDTARAAIQSGLLDVDGTEKDSQRVIESLSGVADILGEDIPRIARSTAQLLRTGLAKDAESAFDLLVKGTQAGLNVSEDLLDTVDEYGTQFRKLGLEGPEAFGLLAQAVRGGARDTDTAADALKEFSIRATDMSKTSVAAFDFLGINASKMADAISAGGPKAAAGLDQVLDKIRGIKDPSDQAAIAVALFGTKAEDMGSALFKMDLSTAVQELGSVEGAASSAIATMGDNAAGSIASAQRNIEVAADGIKGALATAFNPQIQGFATFVTENREAVMTFLLDMANGAFDAGRALANAAADGVEGFGTLVGTVGPQMTGLILTILEGMNSIPFVELDDAVASFKEIKAGADEGFAATEAGAGAAADAIRTNLIENGLDPAQAKLNEVAIPMVAQAALHDASVALAGDLDAIGYAADGSKLKIETHNGAIDKGTAAGKLLDEQLRRAVGALNDEAEAAAAAGEDQGLLTVRYGEGRQALIGQLTQMGYTATQAQKLADKYGAIPGKVLTDITITGIAAGLSAVDNLAARLASLKNRNITVTVNQRERIADLDRANGGFVQAAKGLDRQSMIAPGGSNILWAEPETGWETYISGKPSQRARNVGLLTETARRFGLTVLPTGTTQHADGGSSAPAWSQSVLGIDYDRLAAALSRVQLTSSVVLDGHVVGTSVARWSQKRAKDTGASGLAL